MATVIKEIVDLTVSREQFLCVSYRSKSLRFSLSPSYRNMGAFGAVVLATSDVLKMF